MFAPTDFLGIPSLSAIGWRVAKTAYGTISRIDEDMWDGLDVIHWSGLRHNYGAADDIPPLLRRCASADLKTAARAHDELDNFLYHQGGWVCPAVSAALPFLARLAAEPGVLVRAAVIETIARLARTGAEVPAGQVDPGWPAALRAVTPGLVALLADEDPQVRLAAVFLAGVRGLDPGQAVAGLLARLEAEPDPALRCDVTVALGTAAAGTFLEGAVLAEVALLVRNEPDPQARLAAVHALARLGQPVSDQAGQMLEAVTSPSAAGWRHSVWLGGRASVIVTATGSLLADDPAAAVRYATGVSSRGDSDQRVAAMNHLGSVLEEWRVIPGSVLPFLAGQLRAPEPGVRFRAAYLMAGIGRDAWPFADALAGLAADSAAATSHGARTVVGDAAVWTLIRIGDPRAIPELGSRLRGGRTGFPTVNTSFQRRVGRNAAFTASLPSIGAAVTDADPGARLLGPVTERLRAAADGADPVLAAVLCETLGTWGPQAAPAVPQLRQVLRESTPGRYPSQAAAAALGRIGPAAREAAADLRRHALEGSPEAAWALGRVTGGTQEAVAALIGMIRLPAGNHVLRYLADFGTEAAAAEEWLTESLSSYPGEWRQVEAAHAWWRITGDANTAIPFLAQAARPLAEGAFLPARLAAMKYLALIPDPDGPAAAAATATARSVLANPRRIAGNGGWRAFAEDDQARAAAAAYLSAQLAAGI